LRTSLAMTLATGYAFVFEPAAEYGSAGRKLLKRRGHTMPRLGGQARLCKAYGARFA